MTTADITQARRFSHYSDAFDYAVCIGISAAPLRLLARAGWVVSVPHFDTDGTADGLLYIA